MDKFFICVKFVGKNFDVVKFVVDVCVDVVEFGNFLLGEVGVVVYYG